MAGLKLNGINMVYPSGETALRDVSLETGDKEFLVVVGGANSGKSTLLKIIAGLEEPVSGTVVVDGKDVTEADAKDRDLAMVLRGNTLFANMNVYDNMGFGLKQRKVSQTVIDQRVKAAANILGLTEVLYRKPKMLTAAERQRAAIGRAIVREPSVYLFDEPLAGLDEKLGKEILNIIVNLQARMEGAFVYATKNLSEALAIGTRIAVLKEGFLQQVDTPANLYDYPVNAYVAFYIGSPAINFIKDVKIRKESGRYSAEFGGESLELSEKIVARFENIDEYAENGKTVVLGIRPEDAALVSTGGELKCKVNKIETDGENVFAECNVNGGTSMIVCGQSDVKNGENAEIKIDCDRVYVFDGLTRLTLLMRDEGYKGTGHKDADFVPLSFEEEQRLTRKSAPDKTKNKRK